MRTTTAILSNGKEMDISEVTEWRDVVSLRTVTVMTVLEALDHWDDAIRITVARANVDWQKSRGGAI